MVFLKLSNLMSRCSQSSSRITDKAHIKEPEETGSFSCVTLRRNENMSSWRFRSPFHPCPHTKEQFPSTGSHVSTDYICESPTASTISECRPCHPERLSSESICLWGLSRKGIPSCFRKRH